MRDLKAVKDARDSLRNDYTKLMDAKSEIKGGVQYVSELGEFEQKKVNYILSVMGKLNIQINALTFVLNEDTEIFDTTYDTLFENKYGINKEMIMQDLNRSW